MKKKYAILDYTLNHFTDTMSVDANLVSFDDALDIRSIYLTSETLDLNKCNFEFTLNFDNWEERHFMSTDRVWPLFSNELITIIKKHYNGLKYFPAKLIDKKGKFHINQFSIVQIPRIKNLVNYELSVFERDGMFPEIFASVSKIVFNSDIKVDPIFRIYEYSLVIMITEALKKDLIKCDFKNLSIIDMENYDWDYL